jgi:hypothetical protein
MPRPKLLTATAVALALLLAAQLYAQDFPDRWMPEPPKPPKMPIPPIQPPIREPPVRPPVGVPVELKGYITAVVVDPVDPVRMPGRTEYYFHTVDGQIYRLDLSRARLYLCGSLINYVGTGKLVVVKGYLVRGVVPIPLDNPYGYRGYGLLIAVEVRDPAYPRCR